MRSSVPRFVVENQSPSPTKESPGSMLRSGAKKNGGPGDGLRSPAPVTSTAPSVIKSARSCKENSGSETASQIRGLWEPPRQAPRLKAKIPSPAPRISSERPEAVTTEARSILHIYLHVVVDEEARSAAHLDVAAVCEKRTATTSRPLNLAQARARGRRRTCQRELHERLAQEHHSNLPDFIVGSELPGLIAGSECQIYIMATSHSKMRL